MTMRFFHRALWMAILPVLFVFTVPVMAQDAAANLIGECAATYDPTVNYFPDRVEIEYASTFEVEYFNNYKVIHVNTPWQGAERGFTYVLVQCGTPVPDGYESAAVIEVPIRSMVSMSTTYLPHLVALDEVDALVGVDEFDFIYSPEIRERIDTDELIEVGGGNLVNVEQVLNLDPDLVMTYGLGSPDYDAHPVLIEAGIPVALNADFVETSPLGRAEWLKFTAMFFNREYAANTLFNAIAADYAALTELAASVAERPTVMVNGMFQGTWYVSGGSSFAAQLIRDAGGEYLWADDESVGGVPLSFEEVFDRAQESDFWLNANFWLSLNDGLAEDERYAEFAPFQTENVFNNTARVSPSGANDYTESGVLRPDIVLQDLIHIFHPELLPDHTLYYYQRLS